MKCITFISTGQPTTNPRLVKEVEVLLKLGYKVHVICCFYQSWAQKFDKEIIAKSPDVYIYCGGSPDDNILRYYLTRLRQKLSLKLFQITKKFSIPENGISRTHTEALSIAKKLKTDLYIAHNLGALPACISAAKYHAAKVGYDAEDMHSAQFTNINSVDYAVNKYIEDKYIQNTDYFTSASDLIGDYYKKIYPLIKPVIINNTFKRTHFTIKFENNNSSIIKFFWFSQTVGTDRGIEDILSALSHVQTPFELHLLGNCSFEYKKTLIGIAAHYKFNNTASLQFHDPIPPDEIFSFASKFDIGLATETGDTINRDICLTNKIFTYLQSGLAIIASNTKAQTKFINQYPLTGKLYIKNNPSSLATCMLNYIENPKLLKKTRLTNYRLGQTELNWETESKKFIAVVEKTLSS